MSLQISFDYYKVTLTNNSEKQERRVSLLSGMTNKNIEPSWEPGMEILFYTYLAAKTHIVTSVVASIKQSPTYNKLKQLQATIMLNDTIQFSPTVMQNSDVKIQEQLNSIRRYSPCGFPFISSSKLQLEIFYPQTTIDFYFFLQPKDSA